MGQTKINLSTDVSNEIRDICHKALSRINTKLRQALPEKSHSIDEIAVMHWETIPACTNIVNWEKIPKNTNVGEAALVFATSVNPGRSISVDDLTQVHVELLFDSSFDYMKSPEVQMYEVKGQVGDLFDFVVPIVHKGFEFFVFGNYMDGAIEDLELNPYWTRARASFIGLSIEICDIIMDLQES